MTSYLMVSFVIILIGYFFFYAIFAILGEDD